MAREAIEGGGPVIAPGPRQSVAAETAIIKKAAAVPIAPPSPSIIQDVVSTATTVINKVESFGASGLSGLEHEISQIVPNVTAFVRAKIADIFGVINDTKAWTEQHFGGLIGDVLSEARKLVAGARSEATHLVDNLRSDTRIVTNSLSNRIHSVEHSLGSEVTKIDHSMGDIANAIVRDAINPVEHFVADSEGWFKSHFHSYAHGIEGFIADSEGWFERHFHSYTKGIESFLQDPVAWFEHNWKQAAGDVLKWTEPAPMLFLDILPKVFPWLKLLAANPWDELKAAGGALKDQSNYQPAITTLHDDRSTIAANALALFKEHAK